MRRAIRRLPCRCCRQHGACIQCAHSNCFTAFHPLCARAHGLTVTVLDDEVDAAYPQRWIGKVSVRTTDGRTLHDALDTAPGFPGAGLSDAQHLARFHDCVAHAAAVAPAAGLPWLGAERVAGFLAALDGLATLADVRSLARALVVDGAPRPADGLG